MIVANEDALSLGHHIVTMLADKVHAELGLYYPENRYKDLVRCLSQAVQPMGMEDLQMLAREIMAAPHDSELFTGIARFLTIGETYFFRENKTLNALQHEILPLIMDDPARQNDRVVRIWSAASSTGEEAYTMAVMLHKMHMARPGWKCEILGTDINDTFLEKARTAEFREWSFRGTPDWLKENYFTTQDDKRFVLKPEIRSMVEFRHLNLVADEYPTPRTGVWWDIILCRNVLIYFSPDVMERVLIKMHDRLGPSGVLATSPTEGAHVLETGLLSAIPMEEVLLFGRKDTQLTACSPGLSTVESVTQCLDTVALLQDTEPEQRLLDSTGPQTVSITPATPPVADPFADMVFDEDMGDDADVDRTDGAGADGPDFATPQDEILHLVQQSYDQHDYTDAVNRAEYELERAQKYGEGTTEYKAALAEIIARCHADTGRLDEAVQWCRTGLEFSRLDTGLYFLLASVFLEKQDKVSARDMLRKVLFLTPGFIMAHITLGMLSMDDGRQDQARIHYRNAQSLLLPMEKSAIVPYSNDQTVGRLLETIEMFVDKMQ